MLVLLAPVLALAGPTLELPSEIKGEPGGFVRVAAKTDGKVVQWLPLDAGLAVFPGDLLRDSKTTVVLAQRAGRYRLLAYTAVGDEPSQPVICTVVIGNAPAPGPGPGPDPGPGPGPTPPPAPVPIPLDGLRVLILYESADLAKLPKEQVAAMNSAEVRSYLTSKCVKGADNKTSEWRIWDKDVDASAEPAHWQAALKRPRTAVPWIIISTGKQGFEGPLPTTQADLLALLKRFGG